MARRDRLVDSMTWLIALVVLGFLSEIVLVRKGNLAWDDADYLRRGLTNARLAGSAGVTWVLPRAIGLLLLEQPKPPWLVGWIELGALVLGRRHLDLLILHATILPFAILLIAVIRIGRWLDGPAGGLLALVCLICSPYSLAFGAKVMVESSLALWVLLTYGLATCLLARPSRSCGIALGIVIGLSLLTKLTVALFLPGSMVYLLVNALRNAANRRALLRPLLWSAVMCVAVAGPWYAQYRLDREIRDLLFEVQRACRGAIGPHPDCPPRGHVGQGFGRLADRGNRRGRDGCRLGDRLESWGRRLKAKRRASGPAVSFHTNGVARRWHRSGGPALALLLRFTFSAADLAGIGGRPRNAPASRADPARFHSQGFGRAWTRRQHASGAHRRDG